MPALTQHTIPTPYLVGPVHCYSGVIEGELVLFDTGPSTLQGQQFLQDHINLHALKHVFVTHCHIDHYGQAHWLEKNSKATIYLPYRDCLKIAKHDERIKAMVALLEEQGFDTNYLEQLRKVFENGVLFPTYPENYKVAETEIPANLGISSLNCPGHSQSDLVYTTKEWAVTGDTLLAGIFQSPLLDVDLENGGRFNNYMEYCSSIVKLSSLQGKRIYPSHRKEISSIPAILKFYISKLLYRVKQLHPYRDEENIMVIVDKLLNGRLREVFHIYLKASEIIFMKDFLDNPELLANSLKDIGLYSDLEELYEAALQY